jgi:hypothetical protein
MRERIYTNVVRVVKNGSKIGCDVYVVGKFNKRDYGISTAVSGPVNDIFRYNRYVSCKD